jgi:hypothetical protein
VGEFTGNLLMGFFSEDRELFRSSQGQFSAAFPVSDDGSWKAHEEANKKTIPRYISLTTDFCGTLQHWKLGAWSQNRTPLRLGKQGPRKHPNFKSGHLHTPGKAGMVVKIIETAAALPEAESLAEVDKPAANCVEAPEGINSGKNVTMLAPMQSLQIIILHELILGCAHEKGC